MFVYGRVIVFVGAIVVSARNAQLTWTDGRRWPRKTWSVLVLLATVIVFYTAVRFGLVAMTVNY